MQFRVSWSVPLLVILPLLVSSCAGLGGIENQSLADVLFQSVKMPRIATHREGVVAPLAASGSGVTMEMAVQQAVAWHPSLNEAAGKVRESGQKIAEAKAGYLPGVSGGIRSGYSGKRNGSMAPKFQLNAKQMLYDFGKVSGSVETEIAGQAVNRARFISTTDQLARDTALAVVESQRNKRLQAVAGQQIQGIAAIVRLVGERTDSGASTETDQVQAAARLEAAKATQFQYEAAYGRELANLGSLIGHDAVPSDGTPSWLAQACSIAGPDWNSVPAMLVAEAQRQRAEALLKENRAASLPTVSLEGNAGYDLKDDKRHGSRDVEYSVGLSVSSPLYQGGASTARKRAASYALESADFARDNARVSIQRELDQARAQVRALQSLQASLTSRTQMMVQARDLNRLQYTDLGTRTLLNLLDAEKELHEARLLAVNAEHDLRRLYVTCLYSSGKIRERFGIDASRLRIGMSDQ